MICPPNVSGRRIAGIHKDTAHRSTESACLGVKVMCNVGVEIPELQGGHRLHHPWSEELSGKPKNLDPKA